MTDRIRIELRGSAPVLVGLLGALLVAVGTRLPWYAFAYGDTSGYGTGMSDLGALFAWLALFIAAFAVTAEYHRLLAVGGVVCGLLAIALAWGQLVREHDGILATGVARVVQVDPLEGTWLIVAGALIAITGALSRLSRR